MQDQELYQRIKDGTYYEDGRKWYSTVYMSLMSERYFFIILSGLALLTLLFAVISFFEILPLKPVRTFLYENPRGATHFAHLQPLRENKSEDVNFAIQRHLLKQYVIGRESYERKKYGFYVKVVQQNSSEQVFESYTRSIDRSNPNSPITIYGAAAIRSVEPSKVSVKPKDGEENTYIARVNFIASVRSPKGGNVSDWTAEIEFYYKDIEVVDGDSTDRRPEDPVEITPLEFRVTSYNVQLQSDASNDNN
jgi:type IV secretory pathway component VirB8